jgi:hypothetical protein
MVNYVDSASDCSLRKDMRLTARLSAGHLCEPLAKPGKTSSAQVGGGRGLPKRPDVFLVGGPRCGTTAMTHYLATHPDIYMARKEMHFFGKDLHFGPRFYRRNLEAYLAEFNARDGQSHGAEASVWYLLSTQAAAEIKAFHPDARIIIMLREPTALVHSMYYTFRLDGNEPLPTFEEALAAEEMRRAGQGLSRQTYFAQGLIYRDIPRYTEQVQRYFETFGRERVHVIIYDDLAADTETVYRETLDFLGVDPSIIRTDFRVINEGDRGVKSPALRACLADSLIRSTTVAIARRLPRPIFTALQSVESWLWKANGRVEPHPPLAAGLRAQLKREFAPEIERLSLLLGRDLTHWSR